MGNIFVGGEAQHKGNNYRGERKRPAAQSRERRYIPPFLDNSERKSGPQPSLREDCASSRAESPEEVEPFLLPSQQPPRSRATCTIQSFQLLGWQLNGWRPKKRKKELDLIAVAEFTAQQFDGRPFSVKQRDGSLDESKTEKMRLHLSEWATVHRPVVAFSTRKRRKKGKMDRSLSSFTSHLTTRADEVTLFRPIPSWHVTNETSADCAILLMAPTVRARNTSQGSPTPISNEP